MIARAIPFLSRLGPHAPVVTVAAAARRLRRAPKLPLGRLRRRGAGGRLRGGLPRVALPRARRLRALLRRRARGLSVGARPREGLPDPGDVVLRVRGLVRGGGRVLSACARGAE